jgi:DNA-binding NarL/FixJ family response regulator
VHQNTTKMQPKFRLTYLARTPLIEQFIDTLHLNVPQYEWSEILINRTAHLSNGDVFLLDIRHTNDISILKSAKQNGVNIIVFISNYAYLRQVLMEQPSPILLPDFTDVEFNHVVEQCFVPIIPDEDEDDQQPENTVFCDLKDNSLTDREIQLLANLSQGFLYKEIASQLGISLGTVKQHCHKIYGKLNVNNRTEAINKLDSKSLI